MIPNIGPKGQRQRLTFGLIAFGISVAVFGVLDLTGAARPWRLGVFVPLYFAGIGVFQAQGKT